jgi:hypothetical protein
VTQDAIEDAKELLAKLLEPTPLRDSGHVAMALRPQSAAKLERLIRYHEGYAQGTTERMTQISKLATQLLGEIAKLRAARASSSTGRTLADDFIEGTAPRLFPLAEQLRELLER